MQSLVNKIALWVLGIIVGIVIALLFKWAKQRDTISSYENLIRAEQLKSKIWKDHAERWHIKAEAAEVNSNRALKYLAQYDSQLKGLHDEIAGVNKNLKNLESYSKIASETGIEFKSPGKDTMVGGIPARVYNFNNRWFDVKSVITDSMDCTINSVDTTIQAAYWHRRWLLAKKKYDFEQVSKNPYTKIVYSKNLIVKKRK